MNRAVEIIIRKLRYLFLKPQFYGVYPSWHFNQNFMMRNAPLTIGRYTSIAKGTTLVFATHHVEYVSTHAFGYAGETRNFKSIEGTLIIKPIKIGNDVWIGANVTILGGVMIGDGAIVAAGSVVTHNVKSFAVVGGNPASIIRYRFTKEQREFLKQWAWWYLPEPQIKSIYESILLNSIDKWHKRTETH